MKENDIRPSQYEKAKIKALKKDLRYLQSQKSDFVFVDCPACGSKKNKNIFRKYSFNFAICEKCSTVFMNPRASETILAEFYENSKLYEFWDRYIFPASKEARRNSIFKPRVESVIKLCRKYRIEKKLIIEIGAGYGIFCEELKKKNFFKEILAVEPSRKLAETIKSLGINVINKPVEKIKSNKKADIMAAFEVIEHLFSPLKFLKKCNKLLNNKGLIIITCPNFEGFDIQTLLAKSDSIDAEHINLFNSHSIEILFEKTGFKLIECHTPGKLDAELVRKKILNNELKLSNNNSFLKTILIDRWNELNKPFQEFLVNNKLSSHMWAVGLKKDNL